MHYSNVLLLFRTKNSIASIDSIDSIDTNNAFY